MRNSLVPHNEGTVFTIWLPSRPPKVGRTHGTAPHPSEPVGRIFGAALLEIRVNAADALMLNPSDRSHPPPSECVSPGRHNGRMPCFRAATLRPQSPAFRLSRQYPR